MQAEWVNMIYKYLWTQFVTRMWCSWRSSTVPSSLSHTKISFTPMLSPPETSLSLVNYPLNSKSLFFWGGLSVGSSLFNANGEWWIAWNSLACYSDIVVCWGQLLADSRWGMGCWLWMVDLLETLQHITMTYVSVRLLADWRRGMVVGCSSISWLWGFLHPTGGLGLVWPTNSLLVIIISGLWLYTPK